MRPQDFQPADPHTIAAAQKGGAIRGESRKGETITRLLETYPGSEPAALRAAYDKGYAAGVGAKYQAQKRARREPL